MKVDPQEGQVYLYQYASDIRKAVIKERVGKYVKLSDYNRWLPVSHFNKCWPEYYGERKWFLGIIPYIKRVR